MENETVIQVCNLKKRFGLDAGFFAKADQHVYAVNDVSFEIKRGQTYGLVGESGCGKTTTARLLIRMYEADQGNVIYYGDGKLKDVQAMSKKELALFREKVRYVFQDPSRSLDPRLTVYDILTSSLKYSSKWKGKEDARAKAAAILEETGLDAKDLDRKPSEFSGGQRQRISIARGLIMEPEVLVCDEVVSALDVSVQAQILNLLQDLRKKRGLSFLFIAHDLKVSCWFCDTIGVMYRGMLVEEGPAKDMFKDAVHPYTQALFAGAGGNYKIEKNGEMNTLLESPKGCPYAHRCSRASEKCREEIPEWKEVSEGHKIRCFNA
ncbi:ABC transporter ATP-binding protein [Treponema sp.]|uniref:ABC transporter ATP-binding protein n=1 Tax=Treponema sp. TaxID=166 RepID=UPI001DD9C61D|nr:ABC transporter ATP-binding protein [Treponema sp.]MBS7241530.1 ABC transporter ATP-binding protein [Treponema sp.]MCI6442246.1 ABC transporter ATP-binding protein [Spirochaetia bacterium]MDY4132461.1 ABC transporter ATP-binding protein [Treponema sp.]